MVRRDLMVGRVVLITGGNTGIGRVTAVELARQGAHVFIASRSLPRTGAVLEEIRRFQGKAEWLALDLGDFVSVRACAEAFLARKLPLHVLINNAGQVGDRDMTASGFEPTFGINHMGHFLLTQLLQDCLKASRPARVVTVASAAHYRAARPDWAKLQQPLQSQSGWPEYCISKLANVWFSAELGRRLQGSGVTTYALHPGVIASDLWRGVPGPLRGVIKLFMSSTEQGAATSLFCATEPGLASETGLYYDKCKPKRVSRLAQDATLAAQLWEHSEAWVASGG